MVGYTSTAFGWFDQSAVRGLTRYVFDFAVPMLLLRTLATTNLPDVIPWDYLASYYLGTLIVLLTGIWSTRLFWKRTFSQQVINAFSGSFSNTVLLGIPIILLAFGEEAVVSFVYHNRYTWTHNGTVFSQSCLKWVKVARAG